MIAATDGARQLFHEGIQALSEASMRGMRIDIPYCKKQNILLTKKTKRLKEQFLGTEMGKTWKRSYVTPNINSDTQLRDILFSKMKVKSIKTTEPSEAFPNGQDSVDNETLAIISKDIPELDIFLQYKKLDKVNNTYIGGLLKETVNGIVHPGFLLDRVRTFRSSSKNPNFQNQPNRDKEQKKIVRSAFIPREGFGFLPADFKGIEVAVSPCYHKDPKMLKYVRDPSTDMHGDMAIQCFLLDSFQKEGTEKTIRKGTKNGFVFPQFYGDYYGNNAVSLCTWVELPTKGRFSKATGLKLMTGKYLSDHLADKGIYSFDDFKDHIQSVEKDFWGRRFKVYGKWKETNVEEYYKKGWLKTLTGFVCRGIMGPNDINNYPIQGSAFHCLLKTFIEVNKRIKKYKFKSQLIGQIHDELVLEALEKERDDLLDMIREVVCYWLPKQWDWIIVPLEIEANIFDINANWASGSKEVKLAA